MCVGCIKERPLLLLLLRLSPPFFFFFPPPILVDPSGPSVPFWACKTEKGGEWGEQESCRIAAPPWLRIRKFASLFLSLSLITFGVQVTHLSLIELVKKICKRDLILLVHFPWNLSFSRKVLVLSHPPFFKWSPCMHGGLVEKRRRDKSVSRVRRAVERKVGAFPTWLWEEAFSSHFGYFFPLEVLETLFLKSRKVFWKIRTG